MFKPAVWIAGDRTLRQLLAGYPTECAAGAMAGRYSIVGASVVGRLHVREGRDRDDAWAAWSNGKWLAVSVSDGAGSRPHSRIGAAYAVNRLSQGLVRAAAARDLRLSQQAQSSRVHQNSYHTGLVQTGFGETRRGLKQFASRRRFLLEDLHCTLLGMLINVETGEFGVGQIGDGLIAGLDQDRNAMALVEPPVTGDPGASYFITQPDWKRRFAAAGKDAGNATGFSTFFLMTDGVSSDCQYGPPQDIFQRWARDMNREVRLFPSESATAERLRRYLASYQIQGSFDDRTLVVVYRKAEA